MKYQRYLTVLAIIVAGATSAQASDPVLDWNAISAQAIFTGGHPGATTILDLAVVQVAVHDAASVRGVNSPREDRDSGRGVSG